MTEPRDGRGDSTRLLRDLLENTLDPGYRAAAARRGDRPPVRRWWDRPAVAVGCLLAGFLVVVGYVHTHRAEPAAVRAQQALAARVRTAQDSSDALADRVARAQRQLTRAQAAALPADGGLARSLAAAQQAAGLGEVHGPGLQVTLREPPAAAQSSAAARAGTVPIGAGNILTDRDVRSVVNELWRDGAEAIAVNGIRLTPTTAIRFAGDAVLVDFQPIASPYVVSALGDENGLATRFAQSGVASRYQTLVGADGIGFAVADRDDLVLPAATVPSTRYATARPETSAPPSASSAASK